MQLRGVLATLGARLISPFPSTGLTMFESCGRLSAAGLPACELFNGN